MIQVELQRWSGVFSSRGMDLPDCAKSSRVSGQDSGRKGHQQEVEKGETLQCNPLKKGKKKKPVHKIDIG